MRGERCESPSTGLQRALDSDLDKGLFRSTIPIPRSPLGVPTLTGVPWMKMTVCLFITIIIYLVVLSI